MGEGYAGPVVADGCVYVLDYDALREADTMRCLSLDDGREIWRNSYPVLVVRNHGMSRTVPAIAGPYVVTIGPRCHVACWERETGNCSWLIDLPIEYGTTVPQWYAGQCPLVDGDRLILAPASDSVLLMAVDVASGQIVWKTPNPRRWGMTHSSILPIEYANRRMYVYCASGGVVGVSADDGNVLWESQDWKMHVALSPSPLDLGDGRLLLSSGYNREGSIVLQLDEQDGNIVVTTARTLTPKQFNSEQQTPILYGGHVFGIRKPRGGQLVCMDLDGNEIYHSGADKFGLGPYMIADDLIYLLGDRGLLTMAAASTDQYRPLAQFQVFEDGHDAWGPMALVAGRLIVRDMTRMACLDVRADQ
jgi:outer membrane protein assembly factor BamB